MDDNIDCSGDNAPSEFREGYKAGWKARGEYIQDYREAQSGSAFGMSLMFIGGFMFTAFVVAGIFVPGVVIARVVTTSLVAVGIGVAGYFIDRTETKSYKKRQAEFKEKWGE